MPATILRNLRDIVLFQGVIVLAVGGYLWSTDRSQQAASFTAGAGLMLANLGTLAWSSWRMLSKKPVASTTAIIVIKYALLLGSVFYCARASWFSSVAAGLGIASFMLAILAAAIIGPQHKEE